MTQISPIFQKELDAFEKLLDKNNDWNCGLIPEELESFLLASLQRASLAVVEESVGKEVDVNKLETEDEFIASMFETKGESFFYGWNEAIKNTLATAREITGSKEK